MPVRNIEVSLLYPKFTLSLDRKVIAMPRRNLQIIVLIVIWMLFQVQVIYGQSVITAPIECGAIVDSEFTANNQNEQHYYTLDLAAGDAISVEIIPVGTTPNTYFYIYDRNDARLFGFNNRGWGAGNGQPDRVSDFVVPSTGEYTIRSGSNSAAAYTILVGCLYRDGRRVNPGDVVSPVTTTGTSQTTDTQPPVDTFSGVGFPGLAPVDFSQGVTLPLTLGGVPNAGSISDGFEGIFGYTFTANQGDQFALSFTRQGGNLNLGIAVITSNNVVVFESSLMNARVLITQFTLPVTGDYTIGVYRSSLLQPTDAQATSFQITGTVNP